MSGREPGPLCQAQAENFPEPDCAASPGPLCAQPALSLHCMGLGVAGIAEGLPFRNPELPRSGMRDKKANLRGDSTGAKAQGVAMPEQRREERERGEERQ